MKTLNQNTFAALLFTAFALLVLGSSLTAQNAPIDFENDGNGAQWTWTTFENDTNPMVEIVSNPDMDGINTSNTVAKITALQSGMPWAGCESQHGSDIGSFELNATNNIIKVMVWKPVISDVGVKLVRSDSWSLGEIKVANTLINQWEEITFDFSATEIQTYDQIVFFPDFDLDGRLNDNVVYWDNVTFSDGTTSITRVEETQLSVSPNPAQNSITISSDQAIGQVEIQTVTGELVMQSSVLSRQVSIDISNLPSGIYFLRALNGTKALRFVKE